MLNTPTVSTLSAPTGVNANKATEETARLNAQVNVHMFSGQHAHRGGKCRTYLNRIPVFISRFIIVEHSL